MQGAAWSSAFFLFSIRRASHEYLEMVVHFLRRQESGLDLQRDPSPKKCRLRLRMTSLARVMMPEIDF